MTEVEHAQDVALVNAVRRGDKDAFATLYAAHHPPLYRYALQMCGAGAADDVVQETFMVLLRGERFDPARGTLPAYLFGIARHHILKRLSLTRMEVTAAEEDLLFKSEGADASLLQAGSSPPSPFDSMSRAEAVQAVRAAIGTLPPLYREVVTLCELEELDYATAAAVIGCPMGTVRSRLHRARALLSAKLVRLKADATYDSANGSSHGYVRSGFSRTSGVRRS
jgi:RNA polymerase sigma-70 factor (ECF subfamily)